MTAPHLLLIGAGDLGTEIGLRYAQHDVETTPDALTADAALADGVLMNAASAHATRADAAIQASGDGTVSDGGAGSSAASPRVVAIRRRAELVPAPLIGVAGDIAGGLPAQLPTFSGTSGGPRHLVICLTAGGRDAEDYRRTFLDGVQRVLAAVAARGWAPERAVFVSSTSVCAASGDVDETTPPAPMSDTARILLDAERAFLVALPQTTRGVIVRPSGLYGPGRGWFIDQVRRSAVTDRARMTHRVHRDDVARAVVHLLTMPAEPDDLYLVTDDAPVPAGEVADFIAASLGLTPRPATIAEGRRESTPASADAAIATPPLETATRRLHNTRLHDTGFGFVHPTYREGYAAVLDGEGVRHP